MLPHVLPVVKVGSMWASHVFDWPVYPVVIYHFIAKNLKKRLGIVVDNVNGVNIVFIGTHKLLARSVPTKRADYRFHQSQ